MKGTHSSVARQEKEVFFMSDCVFCKIVSGEIPSPRVYEDDEVIAINDLSPIAPIHVLIIPKKHTENIVTAPVELVAHVKKILPEVTKNLELLKKASVSLSIQAPKAAKQFLICTSISWAVKN